MKVIKRTDEYTIFQRGDNRYAIKDAARKWINGSAKVAILLEHELIDAILPKEPSEAEASSEAEEQSEAQASSEAEEQSEAQASSEAEEQSEAQESSEAEEPLDAKDGDEGSEESETGSEKESDDQSG